MSNRALVLLIGLWITTIWIGVDAYLPAVPAMDEVFGTSELLVNATLTSFMVSMPIGSLIGGPLSDRAGRRALTIGGGVAFAAGCLLCAFAPTIEVLIAFRLVSGFGGGFVAATGMAILDDRLEGAELQSAVTITQSLAIVGPIVAPFLGTLMIDIAGWSGIFVLLAVLGMVCVVLYLRVGETLPPEKRANVTLVGSLGLIAQIARNTQFSMLLFLLCMPALSFGTFLAVCSYVLIDMFGLSNLEYGICYSIVCVASIVAPFLYNVLQGAIGNRRVIWLCIALLAVSGAWTLLLAGAHPLLYVAGCIPFALAEGMARPCAFIVLLRAERERSGSASALVNFGIGIAAGLGTPLAALPWPNYLVAMGVPTLVSSLVAGVLFAVLLFILKSRIVED